MDNASDNENDAFNFDEITKITEKVKNDKKTDFLEKVKNGRTDAISHITKDCKEKMKTSAKKGYDKTILYSFKWTAEKDATHDSDGNKTEFVDGIKLHDLIKKDDNFFKELDLYFNKNNENKFHTGIFTKKNEENIITWNIYVSWGVKYEKKTEKKPKKNFSKEL